MGELRAGSAEVVHARERGRTAARVRYIGTPSQVKNVAAPSVKPCSARTSARVWVSKSISTRTTFAVGELVRVAFDRRGLGAADGRQVHLEDRTAGELVGEAVGAGVVARAEQHDLRGAGIERRDEVVVDEPWRSGT